MRKTIVPIVSATLAICLLAMQFHVLPLPAWATAIDATSISITLDTDKNTSLSIPSVFGTPDGDGLIWTDKTVVVDGDGFEVTLSALAQEFLMSATITEPGTKEFAADVVFILDMSQSMSANPSGQDIDIGGGSTIYRTQAMIKAVNEAIHKVLVDKNGNPTNNRVAVYWFGGSLASNCVGTFMALDTYNTTSSSSNGYSNDGGGIPIYLYCPSVSTVATAPSLRIGGSVAPAVSQSTLAGSPTQAGISYAISNAIKDISDSSGKGDFDQYGKRLPFVMLVSDGAVIDASSRWWQPYNGGDGAVVANYRAVTGFTITTGNSNYGSKEAAAATVLTAAYMKDKLKAAYNTYNDPYGEVPVGFFSVGLGSDIALNLPYSGYPSNPGTTLEPNYAWCALNPGALFYPAGFFTDSIYLAVPIGAANTNVIPRATNLDYMTYAARLTMDQTTAYANAPGAPAGYNDYEAYTYVSTQDYTFANSYSALGDAIDKLTESVTSAIRPDRFLLGLDVNGARSSDSAITFVDVLGQGMELSSLPKLNNVNGTAGVPSLTNHGTYVTESVKYTFLDYDSYVVVATDKDLVDTVIKVTLTWEIDAADLLNHIFRFNDQSDPSAGYKEADPIRLTYKVGMIPEVAAAGVSGNYFANKFASSEANAYAEFAPALDNPSYFKVNDFSKVGVVDTLDNLGYDGGAGYGIGNFYKGTLVPPSPSGTLYNVYVTRAMAEFSQLTPGKEISERQIGTLVSELDVDDYAGNAGFLAALEDSIMNCAAATAADGSDTYGFKTGVPTSTYAGGLQAIILKVDGLDVVGMPDYVSKSSLAVNGVMTTRLGNNGVLELVKTTVAQTIGLSGYSSAYTFGDPAFDVCIQGQSGTGAVTYSLVDNTDGAASISATATGATITLLKAGTFKIKVSIEADNDYDAAEFTTELITVSEEDMLPPTGDGNGITLLLWLAGLSFVILLCMAFRAKRGNPYNNMSSQT